MIKRYNRHSKHLRSTENKYLIKTIGRAMDDPDLFYKKCKDGQIFDWVVLMLSIHAATKINKRKKQLKVRLNKHDYKGRVIIDNSAKISKDIISLKFFVDLVDSQK